MKTSRYSTTQKWLHWVSAIVILWSLLSFYVAVFTVPESVKAWVGFFNVSLTASISPYLS